MSQSTKRSDQPPERRAPERRAAELARLRSDDAKSLRLADSVESRGRLKATQYLIERLEDLRARMTAFESAYSDWLGRVSPNRIDSARNFLHYVSMRQQDLRSLQQELHERGLSSLGRCEANVHGTLDVVINVLRQLSDQQQPSDDRGNLVDFSKSRDLQNRSTADLFGSNPSQGGAHIMVTMPSEAANDRALVSDLLEQGMDCMRINCAHDDAAAWAQMIENLNKSSREQARECKVLMDLAGPKLRTGAIESGPAVLKWRPKRDSLGRVVSPAKLWFQVESLSVPSPLPVDATIPVVGRWLASVQPGDELRLTDARGRKRRVRIVECAPGGVFGESERTTYITPDTKLKHHSSRGSSHSKSGRIGILPRSEQYLVLRRGDRLLLADEFKIGSAPKYDEHGQLLRPATIGCTLPEVFRDLKRGERVHFDDGKITAHVEEVHESYAVLDVTHAGPDGTKLRADKGINLPDTDLHLDALTEKDIEDLKFIVEHADIVAYSFVRRAEDVELLQSQLAKLGRPDMPIVLKIENRQAFECVPSLLLTSMQSPVSGVMIARGDLAVELGWQRLAEVQEEILWMCEAAHVPVVWATQVLESLAKTGIPSRAEITDAAMAVRAECVMLNKGPYILEALRVLSDILRRMQDHQVKKRPLLRRLRLANDLMPIAGTSVTAREHPLAE